MQREIHALSAIKYETQSQNIPVPLISKVSPSIQWFLIAKLIGVNKLWGEAREAERFTLRYFATGSFVLSVGVILLSYTTNLVTLTGLMAGLTPDNAGFKEKWNTSFSRGESE